MDDKLIYETPEVVIQMLDNISLLAKSGENWTGRY